MLQIYGPALQIYTPIPVIYSFLTWKPVLITILSATGYKYLETWYPNLYALAYQPWLLAFLTLSTFKFLKVFVHTVSFYFLTNPARQNLHPTLYPTDVTVIVPSVGEFDNEFVECIETIVVNKPNHVIVSTVGPAKHAKAKQVCDDICSRHEGCRIAVVSIPEPNKRTQFLSPVPAVRTPIIAYADDHVFWPPTFLRSALAPFEDQLVGLVGTVKKVRRDRSGGFWKSVMNYIACLYLERHNFEITASYNLDGGMHIISGRTALVRTCIIDNVHFRRAFLNETWLWGTVGPLKVDDDNCITRWVVNHGWRAAFHNSPDAVVETTLGTVGGLPKFRGQLIRWARSQWRSNSTSLFSDRTCWSAYPWTTYSMFISSLVNIALIYDSLLVFTLHRSGYTQHMSTLVLALVISKLIKPLEHLRKEPRDILLVPMGLIFGYVHSLIKIWAFFTAYKTEWCGREGIR
jgi:cellulose synthase/poly-beta-1,6-N-acetylglucosamine synthase-like glycosyltransferase